MVGEYNYNVAERSLYYEPQQALVGRFSKSFMMRVAAETLPLWRASAARVDRTD